MNNYWATRKQRAGYDRASNTHFNHEYGKT